MPKPQPAAEPETSGYAGYKDFTDYINVHMALAGYNRDSLSQALGRTRTYISTICYGKDRAGRIKTPHYAPSPEMCDAIADLFMGEKRPRPRRTASATSCACRPARSCGRPTRKRGGWPIRLWRSASKIGAL